ncbi:putative acid phosphatase [Halalkaliarchaeum sp. AArc-CO]|uniref:5'/3'-nucleotidase SurE n=1 Tax=unclassified Halalkaliarchaeum TaxID=2678344 RepID=UPI00217E58E0|nr:MULTISPECIES: 5'/3'-nucleotidase SurE [unclassified Halalkaliarchaeum]MDR5672099.1 5'/3'-nucleotidase SurE [Halalkaliarchaeum sp. AArc-GB]UWG51597.1 putative acid phosphatase [Halalkaliarchaeum sp. AArc-CO]
MTRPRILLTNDDGIDAPGLASLYEELTAIADVTVIAPAENQSGVGRTRNGTVTVSESPRGYRVTGTPADCVAFGLGGGVSAEFDFVVAGVNDGPNVGNYVVGRSGTVGACIEASLLDTPGIAVSAYHSRDYHCYPAERYEFDRPAVVARRLLTRLSSTNAATDIDVLNVNAPVDLAAAPLRLTSLVVDYSQRVEYDPADGSVTDGYHESIPDRDASRGDPDGTDVELIDKTWPHVEGYENPLEGAARYRDRYPEASDRRALIDGAVSVSPLSSSLSAVDSPALASLVETIDET